MTARRSNLEIDVEDVAVAVLRSADGIPAQLSLDYVSRRYRAASRSSVEDATLRLDWARGTLEVEDATGSSSKTRARASRSPTAARRPPSSTSWRAGENRSYRPRKAP